MAKKKEQYHSFIEDGVICMECKSCGYYVDGVAKSTVSVLCSRCLTFKALSLWNPMEVKRAAAKKPNGWHWMKELDAVDGNVLHKGKEVSKLKGTLPPTKIKKTVRKKKKKKESYEQKINILAKEYKQKKKLKKEHHGINK